MAKHPRGDVNVTIDGTAYVMKPTFGAMAAIQSQTGLGLGEMVRGMALTDPAKLRVDVVASILFYGITASGKAAPAMDDIGEQVMDEIREGNKPLVTAATAFLLAYFGKPKAGEKKRMARPVCKGEFGWRVGLHQRIRSRSFSPGQDGFRAFQAS